MKVQALMIAAALALGTAGFAQAADYNKAPEKHHIAKVHKSAKKVSLKTHGKLHASQMHARNELRKERREMQARNERREDRREMHARAHINTRTLGAGPSPSVDLNSSARQRRMDAAYSDWQRGIRR